MKKLIYIFLLAISYQLLAISCEAQNGFVGSGYIMQAPRCTRTTIASPYKGLIIYDTVALHYFGYTRNGWQILDSGSVDAASLQYLTAGFGLKSNGNYNTVDARTFSIDDSIVALKSDLEFLVGTDTPNYIIDTIINAPLASPVPGITYLVGTAPTGIFVGHANQPADFVTGTTYTYHTPILGDQGVVGRPFEYIYYDGTQWIVKPNKSVQTYYYDYGSKIFIGQAKAKPIDFGVKKKAIISFTSTGKLRFPYLTYVPAHPFLTVDPLDSNSVILDSFDVAIYFDSLRNNSGVLEGRKAGAWIPQFTLPSGGGGASAFTDLTDVPASYSGQALKLVRVNSGETALQFFTPTYILPGDTAAMLSSYSTKINKNIDSITAHNTRINNESVARDNADIKTLAVTGTTTKTITLTKGDASTITGTFTDNGGGIDSVRQGSSTDTIKQYSGGTGTKAYLTQRVFNVKNFGAVGDSTTNDQAAIQAAINACAAAGGGEVYFPMSSKLYRLGGALVNSGGTGIGSPNSLLYLPQRGILDTGGLITIRFIAEGETNQSFSALDNYTIRKKGVVILADPTSVSGTFPSILGCDPGALSYFGLNYGVQFECRGIQFEVKNRSGSGANMSGLNLRLVANAKLYDNSVIIDTSLFYSSFPSAETFGIYMPGNNNGTFSYADNNFVGGFKYGMVIAEHFRGTGNEIATCDYGLVMETTNHGMHIDEIGIHWCRVAVSCPVGSIPTSGNKLPINIDALNTEYRVAGAWYDTRYTVMDSLNLLNGYINYNVVAAGGGLNNTLFSKKGGTHLNTYAIADSTGFAKLNGNNIFAGTGALFQTLNSNGSFQSGLKFQKNSIDKFGWNTDYLQNGAGNIFLYNSTGSSALFYADTTGHVGIGIGAQTSTPPLSFAATSVANFYNNLFTIDNTSTPILTFKAGTSYGLFDFNNTISREMAIRFLQNGTVRSQLGMDYAGNGTADFFIAQPAATAKFYINTSGDVRVGGDASTSSTSSAITAFNNLDTRLNGNVKADKGFNLVTKNSTSGAGTSLTMNTYTVGSGGDTSFTIKGDLEVTAVSGGTVLLQVTWTDVSNTSRTKSFYSQGTTTATLSTTDASSFPPMTITAKASTTITVATVVTGTITYSGRTAIFKDY